MGTIGILSLDEVEELLRGALVGRIACCDHGESGDARPYVVPLAYGYDGDAIYAHSGLGRKIRMMRAQPLVTFEVDAVEASDCWRSVIAEAIYEELTEPSVRAKAIAIIYPAPGAVPELDDTTIVYRLRLTAKSGRFEVPG
jgi:nitroimidazol reductase NimA-like FMN-containing flavoprotein (pyridoxamine 5'-phosphate oxidase superfamily)